ncbi:MAG TPA: DUF1987 domain-containing protein [Bacteroidetes bacterium]|nr:DUF1987 domain-containing protein [Bacteroidota bacterium]
MRRILITEKEFIPGVVLDKDAGIFELTGKACPENLDEFYDPIFRWLDEYSNDPNDITVFEVKLIYYNTASSKALLKILQKLEKLSTNGYKVKINWYYDAKDEELLIAGEDYAELIKIPFDFIQR